MGPLQEQPKLLNDDSSLHFQRIKGVSIWFFPNTLNTIYVSFHVHTVSSSYSPSPTLSPFPPSSHLPCSVPFLEVFLPVLLMVPSFLVSTDIPSHTHKSESLKRCALSLPFCCFVLSVFHSAFSINFLIIMCFLPVISWRCLLFPWVLSTASSTLCRASLMDMNAFIQFTMEKNFLSLSIIADSFPG